ncbi:exopolyphosphatase, partial [Pseudomonadota bacterium]
LAGFSQQEQQFLAALVRSHRRKLPAKLYKELPKRISKPVKRLAVLLRLAVILHRNRSKAALPEFDLVVEDKNIQLIFPEGWLDEQPLTQADLQQEVQYLAAIGFTLLVQPEVG